MMQELYRLTVDFHIFEADIDKYANNYTDYLYTFINTNFFNGNNKLCLV